VFSFLRSMGRSDCGRPHRGPGPVGREAGRRGAGAGRLIGPPRRRPPPDLRPFLVAPQTATRRRRRRSEGTESVICCVYSIPPDLWPYGLQCCDGITFRGSNCPPWFFRIVFSEARSRVVCFPALLPKKIGNAEFKGALGSSPNSESFTVLFALRRRLFSLPHWEQKKFIRNPSPKLCHFLFLEVPTNRSTRSPTGPTMYQATD